MVNYDTKNYTLEVGNSEIEDGNGQSLIYKVVNKETGVSEYEDFMLPRAISSMVQLQERLEEAINSYNAPSVTTLGLVEPSSLN